MSHIPLPEELGGTFSVRAALGAGVNAERLRRGDLARPFRGVRSVRRLGVAPLAGEEHPAETARRAAIDRALEYSVLMGQGQFFSHETAALLWGIPLPFVRDLDPHVSVFAPARHPRIGGVHGHESLRSLTSVMRHPQHGVLLASTESTWAMLGAVLRDGYDLVAAGDAAVRIPRMPAGYNVDLGAPLTSLAALQAAVDAGRRVGRPALRLALPRVRTGSSSRPESWCRLIIVDAGLPEPEIDVDVYGRDGSFIGCVDLAYPSLKIALEYEGDHHRTSPEQWQRDLEKHDRLVAEGWRVIRISRAHIFTAPNEFIRRLSRALEQRN